MKRTAVTKSGGGRRIKRMLLLAIPAAVALAQQEDANATTTNQTVPTAVPVMNNFTVAAKYQPDSGTLFYDKLDKFGHIVGRVEKFYPLPPV